MLVTQGSSSRPTPNTPDRKVWLVNSAIGFKFRLEQLAFEPLMQPDEAVLRIGNIQVEGTGRSLRGIGRASRDPDRKLVQPSRRALGQRGDRPRLGSGYLAKKLKRYMDVFGPNPSNAGVRAFKAKRIRSARNKLADLIRKLNGNEKARHAESASGGTK